MNDLIVKKFNGKEVKSFVWRDKLCWVGVDVANILGYKDESSSIGLFIKREEFLQGLEYDVLTENDLIEFKEVFGEYIPNLKYTARIIILYEEGLYGFLSASRMKSGVEFRRWIRREVVPAIRKQGYYSTNLSENEFSSSTNNMKRDMRKDLSIELDLNFYKLQEAYKNAVLFKELLDDITKDSTYKFLLIKKLYLAAGIELPKYIEEERV